MFVLDTATCKKNSLQKTVYARKHKKLQSLLITSTTVYITSTHQTKVRTCHYPSSQRLHITSYFFLRWEYRHILFHCEKYACYTSVDGRQFANWSETHGWHLPSWRRMSLATSHICCSDQYVSDYFNLQPFSSLSFTLTHLIAIICNFFVLRNSGCIFRQLGAGYFGFNSYGFSPRAES